MLNFLAFRTSDVGGFLVFGVSNVKILAFDTLYASAHLTNRTKQPHKVEILFSSLGIFSFFLVFRIKLTLSLLD